jgi:hypothetical protein
MQYAKQIWLQSLKGRDHLEDLGIDGRIILECIEGCYGLDSSGSEYGLGADSSERSSESSVLVKGGEFLDQLSDYQPLKKVSVPIL